MKFRRLHRSWILVIAASSIAFINSVTTISFGVFLKPMATEFNVGRGIISGARSLAGLLSGVFGIGVGRLSDRYGPQILIVANGILVGLGLMLMVKVSSVWQIYLFYGLITAAGMACFQIATYSTIPRWFAKRRETALGIVQGGFGLGGMIMTSVIQWLISSYGWRPSYLIAGLLTLAIVLPLAKFIRYSPRTVGLKAYGEDSTPEERKPAASGPTGIPFAQAIKTGRFWLFGSILFCFRSCLGVVTTHIAAYATDIQISAAIAASFIAFISGSGIVGKLSVGFVCDRIEIRPALSVYLLIVTLTLIALLFANEIWMLYAFAIVFGFGYGGVITLPAAVTAELFGLKYVSILFASLMLFGTIGTATGPILAGSLFDIAGNYHSAFILCALISALSLILSLILLRYRSEERVA